MSRADYGRVMRMGEVSKKAAEAREEREARRAFVKQQKERVRRRGVDLRAERFKTEEKIEDAIRSKREQAQIIGDTYRVQHEMLRYKRVVQDHAYVSAGRALTQKYSTRDNQETVRALKKQVCDEKTRAATEMRNALKKAKKETDDNILAVNTDRARRVYTDTAHRVIRFSKQQTVAQRWDNADRVREQVAECKQECEANKADYVERARAIKAYIANDAIKAANATERHYEKQLYARQQTQWRKDIKAEREHVDAMVREQNCNIHDAVEQSHLVPEDNVLEVAGGMESFNVFSRFFDFRKKAPILCAPPEPSLLLQNTITPRTPGRSKTPRRTSVTI